MVRYVSSTDVGKPVKISPKRQKVTLYKISGLRPENMGLGSRVP